MVQFLQLGQESRRGSTVLSVLNLQAMNRHATILMLWTIGVVGCEKSSSVPAAEETTGTLMECAESVELPDEVITAISENAKNRSLMISRKSESVEDQMEVMTGGFHDGRGEVFRFRREGGSWKLISQSIWVE